MRRRARASVRPGRKRSGAISRHRRCSISTGSSTSGPRSKSKSRLTCRKRDARVGYLVKTGNRNSKPMTTNRSTSADYVTAFATGWPDKQPDIMVLSLTTHKGVQDFAFNKEQALLIAKTIEKTAAQLAVPKTS